MVSSSLQSALNGGDFSVGRLGTWSERSTPKGIHSMLEDRNKRDKVLNLAAVSRLPAFARDNLRVRRNVLMTILSSSERRMD
jgi:hypothetical protein